MGVDFKADVQAADRDARRRGGILLALTCLGAPVGLIVWVAWGGLAGLCAYGIMIMPVAVLWTLSVRRAALRSVDVRDL